MEQKRLNSTAYKSRFNTQTLQSLQSTKTTKLNTTKTTLIELLFIVSSQEVRKFIFNFLWIDF